ncbi:MULTISPECIES: hypothetical protein [Agrobacterium]|uniref:hypothetical protein n=1 Tax=Agrobacterium tumefaciens TaxID=358 RepID=UPI000EF2DABA|nr:hypothetical protein At1D1108_51690 [Agrobacterium tumefaciens]NSY09741.1 hypothetical protein [Agrobacterium tumefaciens]NSY93402.1 hypothetical protein [Agrobacterium tumefaciens]
MTYELEIQIEELRAEIATVLDQAERRQIAAELAIAEAQLAETEAAFEASVATKPPH